MPQAFNDNNRKVNESIWCLVGHTCYLMQGSVIIEQEKFFCFSCNCRTDNVVAGRGTATRCGLARNLMTIFNDNLYNGEVHYECIEISSSLVDGSVQCRDEKT